MFKIRKPTPEPVIIIRQASAKELFKYETRKGPCIDNIMVENKIKVINPDEQTIEIGRMDKSCKY
jgi:hypothetical protein